MGQQKALQQAEALPIDRRAVPLEPRVMLDANLDIDLSGGADLTAILSGLAQIADQQADNADAILDQFDASAGAAFDVLGSVLGDSGDDLTAVSETVDRIRSAISELRDSITGGISGLIDGDFASDLADAANDSLGDDTSISFSGNLSASEIAEVFTVENFTDGTIFDDLEDLLDAEGVSGDDMAAALSDVLDQVADAMGLTDTLSLSLSDIVVDGETLVSFTDNADGAVSVEVALDSDGLAADFDSAIADLLPGLELPFDLSSTDPLGGSISFQISVEAELSGGALDSLELHIDNFSFDPLVSVGGEIDTGDDATATLGLVGLTVESFTTALFSVVVTGADTLDLGGVIDFGSGDFDFFGDEADLGVSGLIQEVGGSGFTEIEANTSYDLFQLDFTGTLEMGESSESYSGVLTLSSVLDTASGEDPATVFADNASVDLSVDFDDASLGTEALETLTATLEALFSLDAEDIIDFLGEAGANIAGLLKNSVFDFEIPLSDLQISDVLDSLASVFSNIADTFSIDTESLGFSENVSGQTLSAAIAGLTGSALTASDLDALSEYSSITLTVTDAGTAVTGIEVNLEGSDVLDTSLSVAERLAALATLLQAAVSPYGLSVGVTATGGLRITSDEQEDDGETYRNSLAVTGATRADDDSEDDDFSLIDLGFASGDLGALEYSADGTLYPDDDSETVSEYFLGFSTGTDTVTLDTLDIDDLAGVTSMRFTFTVDGVERKVDIASDTGWDDLASFVEDFNAALDAEGVGVTVGSDGGYDENGDLVGGTGLSFTLDADETRSIQITVEDGDTLRATTIDGLLDWVNSELSQAWEGAALELTEDGALVFVLPEASYTLVIEADDGVFFSAEDVGLSFLGDVTLSADLAGELTAALTSSIGIDLAGLGSSLIDIASNALQGASDLGEDLFDALLDYAFIEDVTLTASASATATDITGSADLGIAAFTVGTSDPSANFVAFDVQMLVTLVGTDSDGLASNRITMHNLYNAVTDVYDVVDGETVVTEAEGIDSLIGLLELSGGLLTDGEGRALASDGSEVADSADLQTADAFDYGGDGTLAEFVAYLGDITLSVGDVAGLNEGVIDGIGVTVTDLFDLDGTTEIAVVSEDESAAAALEALGNLEDGDILDALTAIAHMLVVVGEALEDYLPYLDAEIPLLNFSILDAISFSADFLEALQDIRNDMDAALDTLDSYLEDVFGEDTVELGWDSDASTLTFALSFQFLDDYSESLPFQLDLAELLGDALADIVGEDLADTVTGLVDASGEGALVFDPLLSLDFTFGLDLSGLLADPTDLAELSTALGALATTGAVNMRPSGGNDLRITRFDADGNSSKVEVDLDGLETLEEVIAAIDAAVDAAFDGTVSFTYDAETGQITLSDSGNSETEDTGLNLLFGSYRDSSENDDGLQEIALDDGFTDYESAATFDVQIGDERVTVTIEAEAGRDQDGFVDALNAALAAASIDRGAISDTAIHGTTVALSSLMTARVTADGSLALTATGYDTALSYDTIEFSVTGEDLSEGIGFAITDLGGANIAEVLGFESSRDAIVGDITSGTLYVADDGDAIRIYLDTEESGIKLSFSAGVEEGLNLTLALGPLSVSVTDGHAYISAADGSGDPAYIFLGINDIDGDEYEGQYDLSHLATLFSDTSLSVSDLFSYEVSIGIDVSLPMSDSIGLFDPDTDGLTWQATLLSVSDATAATGGLIDIFNGNLGGLTGLDFTLPDLSDYLENLNILSLLNDPVLLLEGLDMIIEQIQSLFDDFLSDINLPIVGDSIGVGVTFFEEFRMLVLEDALEYASTPLADGTMPTTVDLITGFLNDALNDLLGTSGETYLQAYLNTDGGTEDSYVYAALNFGATIFSEYLDIDFDLGIPGFDLEVEEGSQILMQLYYSVNIGFGYDSNGFFLLNDTDTDEITLEFSVDAGSFEASMALFEVLGVSATAVTLDDDGNIISTASDEDGGTAKLTATMGADLYGDQGLAIIDPDDQGDSDAITSDGVYRDFSGVTPLDGIGEELTYETVVYLSQLDTSNLISFTFEAEVAIVLSIEGNILDPTTGKPIEINGVTYLPSVATELEFVATFSIGDGLNIETLMFHNVRVDISEIYDALIAPILDPLMDVVEPLAEFFKFLNEEPMSILVDILGEIYPIIKMAGTVAEIGEEVTDFLTYLNDSEGIVMFGDYDFSSMSDDLETGDAELSDASGSQVSISGSSSSSGYSGKFGVFGSGALQIEIPLLTNPFSVIDLLLGNYEDVVLVELRMVLFNFDTGGRIDLVDEFLDLMDMPGWAADIVSSIFEAGIEARFVAQIEVGYDLSGIVNFVNTLDPERLLDGIFLSTELVDVYVGLDASLSSPFAGLSVAGYAGVTLYFNDPNHDGKLRLTEMIAIVEAAYVEISDNDILEALGYIFYGEASFGFELSVWVGIDLLFTKLSWDIELFKEDGSVDFGGNPVSGEVAGDMDGSGTVVLNIGSNAGASNSAIQEDGDDTLVITGPNSPIQVTYTQGGKKVTGEIDQDANALVIPAGSGDNEIDLSGITNDVITITYTGSGEDTITLPNQGLHVVFAGDGDDTITVDGEATGTYIIFGEAGSDTVEIDGGNVVYIGSDDYGLRDLFIEAFSSGDVTATEVLSLLGLNADGTVDTNSDKANYDGLTLSGLLENYTALTQTNADKSADTITLGSGNAIVLTGGGDDVILIDLTNDGEVRIYSGAGDDIINAGGSSVYVEGGAGSDLIVVDGDETTVWGWGAQAGESGLDGDDAIDTLALRDGMDVITGGSGSDMIYGQNGDDILQGGLGDDMLSGGLGDDLVSGGTLTLVTSGGTVIDLTTFDVDTNFTTNMILGSVDAADGDDTILGGKGSDIMMGGGGADSIEGGTGKDILIGDFAEIKLSPSLAAGAITSTYVNSRNAGQDALYGGTGDDILIAGGAGEGEAETLTDTEGSNILIGDFAVLEGSIILDAVTKITTLASDMGGDDILTAGNGTDILIGGEGSDVITAGLGADIVLGDLGIIDFSEGTIWGASTAADGNDTITVGNDDGTSSVDDLKDIVIGSLGDDTLTAGDGGLVVLGDGGTITTDPTALNALRTYVPLGPDPSDDDVAADLKARNLISALAASVVSTPNEDDGDDTVTVAGGETIAVLGGGSDVAELADGVNYVLGDDGTITIEANADYTGRKVELTSAAAAAAVNDDRITTGSGSDVIVGGEGSDEIRAGVGDNAILGDNGTLSRDDTGDTLSLTLKSAYLRTDGDDLVVTGLGDDAAVLGGGDDTAKLGDGDNIAMGDSGTATWIGDEIELESANPNYGGDDSITTGSGDDAILAGSGNDTVNAGNGSNAVIGDNGHLKIDEAGIELTSTDPSLGGNDKITTGSGNDAVLAGVGSDTVDAGNGSNAVIGDNGHLQIDEAGIELTSSDPSLGGNDKITTGSGNDAVLAGVGSDTVDAGNGGNAVIGDNGHLQIDEAGIELTSTDPSLGGNDKITTGSGNDAVLAGVGSDTVDAGNGGNAVIGDNGHLQIDEAGIELTSTDPSLGGNDKITTGSGNDAVLAGVGSDTVDAGNGSNAVIGDNGHLKIDEAGIELTSANPSVGGNDKITTGSGKDAVLAGVGSDTVSAGDGENFVLGDNGWISLVDENVVETSDESLGGDDVITTGKDDDVVIGGTGSDTIALGDGDNRALGDSGYYRSQGELVSAHLDSDGADKVTSGTGSDFVVIGGDADTAALGDGDNRAIGDSGRIVWSATEIGTMETTDTDTGAGDRIVTGSGSDAILGGDGGDTIDAGDGDNAVIGDQGRIELDAGADQVVARRVVTKDVAHGGGDVLTTGKGDDIVLAGAGGDTVSTGAGEDAVLGDNGEYVSSHMTGTGSLTAAVLDFGGDDVIYTGADADIVMGSQGNDRIEVGEGEDVALGDDGTVTFINRTDVQTLVLTNIELGGDDIISASNQSGDSIFFGQAGADTVIGGSDDDIIIGDLVEITFTDASAAMAGQSAVDRVDYMIGVRPDLGFGDHLSGVDGNDFIIGGFGDDEIHGGDGQDFLIGDTIIYQRSYTEMADGTLFEVILLDTNFAYRTGGYDTIYGEAGSDVMIGNLGPDLFYGDTEEDVIFSDGYAGEYHGRWSSLGFEGDTAFRTLWKSNFAGPGAIDVVSRAQQDDSIGSPLDLILEEMGAANEDRGLLAGGEFISEGAGIDTSFFAGRLLDFLETDEVVGTLATLVTLGADQAVLAQALEAAIAENFGDIWDLDAPELELVIKKMISFLLSEVQAEDAATGSAIAA
ncbi:hypothetical protein JMM61_16925 [Rhodovulum sulfidophilum]|uniref:beta strand repeat-containing protein n=1 Tax=Rhodovulum sulfidophilum TaxID=35806 RepID=UPI0019296355|nr:calcium-binding protein [Rhodovulum sulfidophilum]MBL3587047.1 hypothetical protein [Rhodovulum sulfidophilum]